MPNTRVEPRTVASYETAIEAQRVADVLRDEGIEAFVGDEHTATWFWQWSRAMGGCRVLVADADLDRALDVVARLEAPLEADGREPGASPDAPDDVRDPRADAESWARATLTWAIVGIALFPIVHFAMAFRLRDAPPGLRDCAPARRLLLAARAVLYASLAGWVVVLWLAFRGWR